MQPQLFPPLPLEGPPLAVGRYLVRLQDQFGEIQALSNASQATRESLTPLINFVGRGKQTQPISADTVRNRVNRIGRAVGPRVRYLDTLRVSASATAIRSGAPVPLLEAIFDRARRTEMRFIPVLSAGDTSARHRHVVSDAVAEDGRGLGLRYRLRTVMPSPGQTASTLLLNELDPLSIRAAEVDLLLDLEYLDADSEFDVPALASSIDAMASVAPWRGLAVLGTSIPSSLGCVEQGTLGRIPRREWDIWLKLATSGLRHQPCFGDYAIQHPRPPSSGGMGMRANIRYTTSSDTLVARGHGPFMEEGKAQYRELCNWLASHRDFSGADYTWGDGIIDACAQGACEPGAQPLWRGVGTSHHLRFVTEQLRLRAA